MVQGKTSQFIENFKSFTADDELMLANLKQALNYSMDNLAIPDSKLNLSSNKIPNNTTTTKSNNINENNNINDDNDNNDDNTIPTKYPTKYTKNNFNNINNNTTSNNITNNKNANDNSNNNNDNDNDSDSDSDSKSDNESDDESDDNKKKNNNKNDNIEHFRGSIELESKNLHNILLSLLITFIGYLVIHIYTKNYIAVETIAPDLKKMKHLIYGIIYFILIYICLEIF